MKVNDFLLEIGVEELPTQSLLTLVKALEQNLQEGLSDHKIDFLESQHYVTPRRLAVLIKSVNEKQENQLIERQGPTESSAFDSNGTPTLAYIGFAKSCGVSADQLQIKETPKGSRIYCRVEKPGKNSMDLLPSIIENAIHQLPVNKPMRWGSGEFSFVRPVHWLVALWGSQVIAVTQYGQPSSKHSFGHRFHSPKAVTIHQASEYANMLLRHKVIADFEQRKNRILEQIEQIETQQQIKVVMDSDLLNEVTALVEWPVCLVGKYNPRFLRIPAEVLMTSMKSHQKCFAIRNKAQQLEPLFLLVSNIESREPEKVIAGNERVIHARLSDAEFFFYNDQRQSLEYFNDKLKPVIFEKELGTQAERVKRLQKLSEKIAEQLQENVDHAKQAASLSKFDLMTEMVGEFPELQGVMGYHYAIHAQIPEKIALSIQEHYYPRFSGDRVPNDILGTIVALADRLDLLCGIFGINKIPSGEKDPYALRRAAQGLVRILIEKRLPLDLKALLTLSIKTYQKKFSTEGLMDKVQVFILERMRSWYLDSGVDANLFASVAAKNITSPLDFDQRIKAVNQFRRLEEAQTLAAANKRVNNLLKKSEKISAKTAVHANLFESESEHQLAQLLDKKGSVINRLYQQQDYGATLSELASFKSAIDDFFENVMVMVDNKKVRDNRLALLSRLRELFTQVADISLI